MLLIEWQSCVGTPFPFSSENADLNLICLNLWHMAATTVGSVQKKQDFGSESVNHCLLLMAYILKLNLYVWTRTWTRWFQLWLNWASVMFLGRKFTTKTWHVSKATIEKRLKHRSKSTFDWGADAMPNFDTRISWPTWPSEIWSYSANSLIP